MPTRAAGTPRQCPIGEGLEQCPRTVRAGQLMCPAHWRLVPKAIANRVWRTWRAFCADGTDEQWAQYADAREDALAAVAEATKPKQQEETTSERPW
jgi:hypothetical protein